MAKRKTLEADGTEITILSVNEQEEFFSLTDLAKRINPENPAMLIVNWMRLKDTIAFLGVWEKLNNPNFNLIEFDKGRAKNNLVSSCV